MISHTNFVILQLVLKKTEALSLTKEKNEKE